MYFVGKKGKNGYGYRSTAEEVAKGIDASNITAIVTGKCEILNSCAGSKLSARIVASFRCNIGWHAGEE